MEECESPSACTHLIGNKHYYLLSLNVLKCQYLDQYSHCIVVIISKHLHGPTPVISKHLHGPIPVISKHLHGPIPVISKHLHGPIPVISKHLQVVLCCGIADWLISDCAQYVVLCAKGAMTATRRLARVAMDSFWNNYQ